MGYERDDYMRRQEADHDLLRMRQPRQVPRVLASCAKGEHLHVTGRRYCPDCGHDLWA